MSRAVMQQALEALEEATIYTSSESWSPSMTKDCEAAITALRAALAEPEQEPLSLNDGRLTQYPDGSIGVGTPAEPEQQTVAWLITDEKINSLQVASIQRLIDRAKHAHHTDVLLRINGTNERYEADWLKHMTRTAPPQRKPLTDEEIDRVIEGWWRDDLKMKYEELARAIERAIWEKNT